MHSDTPPFRPLFLLVEDSEDDAFFFERSLGRASIACDLERVTDGAEAIRFLQQRKESSDEDPQWPQLVFLDLKMPGMSGFEVLSWIREQKVAHPPDIIILSGSDHDNDIARALRQGADSYLVKPATAGSLKECILPRLQDRANGSSSSESISFRDKNS